MSWQTPKEGECQAKGSPQNVTCCMIKRNGQQDAWTGCAQSGIAKWASFELLQTEAQNRHFGTGALASANLEQGTPSDVQLFKIGAPSETCCHAVMSLRDP
mmetsp:Transcript_919/g.2056  ORF Transcript_919/g.2056 Transcript_919/m.2056 type:complete len:101 (+) Transcript_919:80-382(+)